MRVSALSNEPFGRSRKEEPCIVYVFYGALAKLQSVNHKILGCWSNRGLFDWHYLGCIRTMMSYPRLSPHKWRQLCGRSQLIFPGTFLGQDILSGSTKNHILFLVVLAFESMYDPWHL